MSPGLAALIQRAAACCTYSRLLREEVAETILMSHATQLRACYLTGRIARAELTSEQPRRLYGEPPD